ncbi:RNA polymerase sigma factor [Sphingobacterium sp. DN00404]|uniref:RNA polymerase sigma factor n=1 Tax=Sphingobacterium micropteri TaxID=2763501 RepID=A0ABR7YJ32_9SPHI|nr:RNA polymerase sigma factor [Sphingobacterium micropteri]MBD1431266.1 RNA polymerase sigma factor [Sphingobacterium micropteri]
MNDCTEENRLLWLSFLKGDQDAFSTLYKNNYRMLYAYGRRLQMEENQIRDIIHDIFLKLYAKPDLIKNVTTIRPFLLVSMRNAFINWKKKMQRQTDMDVLDFDLHYTVENEFWDKEQLMDVKKKVEHIVQQLTPRQKEIIYLRFLYEMSYEEVAQIMGMSEQAARNLVYRTMDRIRKDNLQAAFALFLF